MEYYEQIVKNRNSCRLFSDRKVEDDKLVEIRKYYEDEESDLVDEIATELRFYIGTVYDELKQSVGYNGFCIKAPAYMLLFSDEGDHFLENAGYIAQGITLKMTELGLAACWMTINDAEATKAALDVDTDKTLACVVAFGYRSPDNTEKKAPKKSLDELTDGRRFGKDVDTDLFYPELEYGLRAMAHAQSFANKQPYKVIVDDDMISLIGLEDEETNEYDTHLNYGIVMFNFYAVMQATRPSAPKWSFEAPDRDLGLPENAKFIAKCGL
jgi:nitroreductase